MSKFKVGDRVRVKMEPIINLKEDQVSWMGEMDDFKGMVYTIAHIYDNWDHRFNESPWSFLESWLEEVTTLNQDLLEVAEAEMNLAKAEAMRKAVEDNGTIRSFDTGATRDTAQDKLDYEGFEHPAVFKRFAEYMHANREQSDGTLRASDNWQKGIPQDVYLKSLYRHYLEVQKLMRSDNPNADEILDALAAIRFNASGLMLEILKHGVETISA